MPTRLYEFPGQVKPNAMVPAIVNDGIPIANVNMPVASAGYAKCRITAVGIERQAPLAAKMLPKALFSPHYHYWRCQVSCPALDDTVSH